MWIKTMSKISLSNIGEHLFEWYFLNYVKSKWTIECPKKGCELDFWLFTSFKTPPVATPHFRFMIWNFACKHQIQTSIMTYQKIKATTTTNKQTLCQILCLTTSKASPFSWLLFVVAWWYWWIPRMSKICILLPLPPLLPPHWHFQYINVFDTCKPIFFMNRTFYSGILRLMFFVFVCVCVFFVFSALCVRSNRFYTLFITNKQTRVHCLSGNILRSLSIKVVFICISGAWKTNIYNAGILISHEAID